MRFRKHTPAINAIKTNKPAATPTTTGTSGNSAAADAVGSDAAEVDNNDDDRRVIVVDMLSSEAVMMASVVDNKEPVLDVDHEETGSLVALNVVDSDDLSNIAV